MSCYIEYSLSTVTCRVTLSTAYQLLHVVLH